MCENGFHVISRFRNDVVLYYPTLEQKTGKRGHPKWFDGRIDFANLDLTRCKEYELYGEEQIHERHRHRYEVNNDYRKVLTENGMKLSGISPDGRIVEMVEIPSHPWFLATQAHPELKSRPNRPHPLFRGFIKAALDYQENK